jgi:hypothetical protein
MIQYRPRLRCQRRGLLEILRRSMAGPPWHPLWATSTAASAPASAPSSTRSPQPHRLPHSLSAVPKPAKSRITHSAEPADRGFGHPRLSGAYRQPKLFRTSERQLSGILTHCRNVLKRVESGRQKFQAAANACHEPSGTWIAEARFAMPWECQDFRVWSGIMGKQGVPYVSTQRACHPK